MKNINLRKTKTIEEKPYFITPIPTSLTTKQKNIRF